MQSVGRAVDLIEALATDHGEGAGLGVSQLSERTGLPYGTVHRLLATLAERGWVRQTPSRKYALGPRLVEVGGAAGRLLSVWAQPFLLELMTISGETTNLAVLEGGEVVYVGQVASRHSMRMFTEPGRRLTAHDTAVGKVLLAGRPLREATAMIGAAGLPRRTPATITEPNVLLAELDAVRERGWAIDDGEHEIGVRCVAVPVAGDGRALAAISVSGPEGRFTADAGTRIVPEMQRVAGALATHLTGVHVR